MILKIRATIPQSKVFFKLYAVKEEMNLFAFNSFITSDLGFSPDQMVCYEGYDETGALKSEYAMFDMGDGSMDQINFSAIIAKEEVEVHYVYDLRNNRYIKLVFEGEEHGVDEKICPCLLEEKGHGPDQFNTKYEDYEAMAAASSYHPVAGDDTPYDDEEDDDVDAEDMDEEDVYDEEELGN